MVEQGKVWTRKRRGWGMGWREDSALVRLLLSEQKIPGRGIRMMEP